MDVRTLATWAGETPQDGQRALAPPIVTATSFAVHPGEIGFSAEDIGEDAPYFYSRWANPTVRSLEEKVAALDGGEDAVCFATGMAAATGLLLHLLRAGDRLVVSDVCYAGVAEFVRQTLPKFGVEVVPVDLSDLEEARRAIRPGTRLVYAETPANPILRLTDVPALAEIAREAGAELAVDATIATPIGLRPLAMGATYVVHSLTKYACGHGNALGGAVIGGAAAMARLRQDSLIHLGASMSPHAAATILQGLATLPLRMRAHEEGALRVAAFLEGHARVRRVLYPGIDSHPQRDLARRQMANTSGLMAYVLADGGAGVAKIAERLRVVTYAVSLGKHRSLLYYIPTEDILRTSFRMDDAHAARYREWAGEGVFRLSVGLEAAEDLIEDLGRALAD
jgi:cystathionine gamma-synthase/methionine-gamma-lyase